MALTAETHFLRDVRGFLMFCLGWMLTGCGTVAPPADPSSPPLPDDFARQPALDERIEAARFDRELMARAIFHETNQVRRKLGLPEFRRLPKLDEAADLEAAVGKVYQPPSHTNPFPMIGTPFERVQYVGLKIEQVAENIALLSIYETQAGVGMVMREGKRHFLHPGTHAELQRATYRWFAREVVRNWMESPGHRANIVNPSLAYLGCSVQPSVSLTGMDQLFCVQVFFTPKK
ncbi:MAG TPA: CAP domain-containing protein [Lacunisphaera sp.]